MSEKSSMCLSCGAPETTAEHRDRCNAAARGVAPSPTIDPIAEELDRAGVERKEHEMITTPNFERAYTALRSLGDCSAIERVAECVTHIESDGVTKLSDDHVQGIAARIAGIAVVATLDEAQNLGGRT